MLRVIEVEREWDGLCYTIPRVGSHNSCLENVEALSHGNKVQVEDKPLWFEILYLLSH